MRPHALLCGSVEPVASLVCAPLGLEESSIVVVGRHRSVSVWESAVCVSARAQVSLLRPSLAALLSDGIHVAVAGSGSEVEVVRLHSLEVVLTLQHGHQSWITALHPLRHMGTRHERRAPVLASVSEEGLLVFWSLDLLSTSAPPSAIPVASLVLRTAPENAAHRVPCGVSVASNSRTFAVLFGNRVEVYQTHKPALLFVLHPPPHFGALCGVAHALHGRLVAWDCTGRAALWKMPHAVLAATPEPHFGPSSSTAQPAAPQRSPRKASLRTVLSSRRKRHGSAMDLGAPQLPAAFASMPFLRAKSSSAEAVASPAPVTPDSNTSASATPSPPPPDDDPYFDDMDDDTDDSADGERPGTSAATAAASASVEPFLVAVYDGSGSSAAWRCSSASLRYFCTAYADGSVRVWQFPAADAPAAGSAPVAPLCSSSLACGWPERVGGAATVTASAVVDNGAVLVEGYSDGTLLARQLPLVHDAAVAPLWVHAHAHRGPITCAWSPRDTAYRSHVVTGGADCRVVVWHGRTGQHIQTFSHHVRPIERVFGPPAKKETDIRWKNCFLTVSRDRAVGVFSMQNYNCQFLFAGHSGPIESVHWREDQDFLITGCGDGSASIWDLGSGSLLQWARDQRAHEVLASCADLLDLCEQQAAAPALAKMRPPKGGADAAPASSLAVSHHALSNAPVVSVLLLSLPALLQELIAHVGDSGLLLQHPLSSAAMAACPGYAWLAHLLPWEVMPADLCAELERGLLLTRPLVTVCHGLRGEHGFVSLLVPQQLQAPASGRWATSGRLTAVQLVAALCVVQRLLYCVELEHKNICSKLLSFVLSVLAERVSDYHPASLLALVQHSQHALDDVAEAARSVFQFTVERMAPDEIQDLVHDYAGILTDPHSKPGTPALAALALASIGWRSPAALDAPLGARVLAELIRITTAGTDAALAVVAAELLGRGYALWFKGGAAQDSLQLLERLLRMSLQKEPRNMAEAARRALLAVGAVQPDSLIKLLGNMIGGADGSVMETNVALQLIRELAKKAPVSLLPHLALVVSLVVKPLDPVVAHKRKGCLSAAGATLEALVKKFPMVTFHQEAQRVAVGTSNSNIVVFDLQARAQEAVAKRACAQNPYPFFFCRRRQRPPASKATRDPLQRWPSAPRARSSPPIRSFRARSRYGASHKASSVLARRHTAFRPSPWTARACRRSSCWSSCSSSGKARRLWWWIARGWAP